MGNLGEARAQHVIEAARIEQRGPFGQLLCVGGGVCPVFAGLIGADATDAGRSSFCRGWSVGRPSPEPAQVMAAALCCGNGGNRTARASALG